MYEIEGDINEINMKENSPTTKPHAGVVETVSIEHYNLAEGDSDEVDISSEMFRFCP